MNKIIILKSNAIYILIPAMMHQIVFTKKEIVEESARWLHGACSQAQGPELNHMLLHGEN